MNYITPITRDKSFEILLTDLPLPVCLLDKAGRYTFQNKAFAFLRERSSNFVIGDYCRLSGSAAQNDLRHHIETLGTDNPQTTLHLSCPHRGETLWLTLTAGPNIGDVMVTVLMPDLLTLDARVLENRLREIFGLTEMEAKCAVLLTHGSIAREIADIRGVSLPTIRTQLKAIREKMNVKTSLAIAAKVSKLSLPLGGSTHHAHLQGT